MKTLTTIVLLFPILFSFSQTKSNTDALCNLTIKFKPAVITILTDTDIFSSSINNGNIDKMIFTSVTAGQYRIQISGQGQQTIITDSIFVSFGQNLVLHFDFNGPCLYDHPSDFIPTCPKNHTDNIIPIVYGLVATKMDKLAKDKHDMKVKYGGCLTTGCDPLFYCKEHNIEF